MGFIDTDTHVFEPITVYRDYLDARFRDRAPAFLERDGRLMIDVAGHVFPSMEGHPGLGNAYGATPKVDHEVPNDPSKRLAHMDENDVDAHVIFPTLGLTGFPGMVDDEELAVAFARAHNTYMLEFCSADPKRLIGAMIVPMNHPEAAARELRRAAESGLAVAVSNPTPPGDIPWSHTRYDPIWEAAQETNVPTVFHEVTIGCPPNAVAIQRYAHRWPLIYVVTHVVEAMLAATDVVLGGVCERFPGARFGIAEAHVAWLPGWLRILDDNFGRGTKIYGTAAGEAALSMLPSQYVQRQFTINAFVDDSMLAEAVDAAGASTITLSTDWPHPIGEDRPTAQQSMDSNASLDDSARRLLLHDNAVSFYLAGSR